MQRKPKKGEVAAIFITEKLNKINFTKKKVVTKLLHHPKVW